MSGVSWRSTAEEAAAEITRLRAQIAELEGIERGMGAVLRLSDEKRRQAEAKVAEREAKLVSLDDAAVGKCVEVANLEARVAELESRTKNLAPLWCTGRHRYAFRPGERAEVIGIGTYDPGAGGPRPALRVRYDDGTEDLVALTMTHGERPDCELTTDPTPGEEGEPSG